jgi:hypothetical protein
MGSPVDRVKEKEKESQVWVQHRGKEWKSLDLTRHRMTGLWSFDQWGWRRVEGGVLRLVLVSH